MKHIGLLTEGIQPVAFIKLAELSVPCYKVYDADALTLLTAVKEASTQDYGRS